MNRSLAIMLLLTAAAPSTASAFRTTADTDGFDPTRPVRWSRAIRWRVDPAGLNGVESVALEAVVAAAWTQVRGVSCASIVTERVEPGDGTTIRDGVITIRGLGDRWASRGFPSDAAGRTEVVYEDSPEGFRIVDADVFLNDGQFDFAPGSASSDARDLLPVVLHELLHALGMEHCCGRLEGAVDCTVAPLCEASTMFPLYRPATQSVVGPDDAAGLCWLYPVDACTEVSCEAGMECVMGECGPVGQSCEVDAACPAGQSCQAGRCTLNLGTLGDPCSWPAECVLGVCDSGRCAASCSEAGAECAPGFECDGLTCRAFLAQLGEPCGTSADCTGAECLAGVAEGPVCTRACGSGCPAGWLCSDVDGERVCRPGTHGCSTSPSRSASLLPAALVLLGLFALRRKVSA